MAEANRTPAIEAESTRPYIQRERVWIQAYIDAFFRGAEVRYQHKLGPIVLARGVTIGDDAEGRALRVFSRRADAVIFSPGEIVVIEGKRRPRPSDISQLEYYLAIAPDTPGDKRFQERPIRGLLLWARNDPVLAAFARGRGLQVVTWLPEDPSLVALLFGGLGPDHRGNRPGLTPTSFGS